jgi:ATP dependent DNA ligase domain
VEHSVQLFPQISLRRWPTVFGSNLSPVRRSDRSVTRRSCIIDGEAVVCDDNGVASFDRIRYRRHDGDAFLYAFDLIELNGDDLRRDPLQVRKATLASIVAKASPGRTRAQATDNGCPHCSSTNLLCVGLILRFRSIPTPQSAIRSVGHDSPGQSKNCIQHQRAKAGSCGNARSILTLYRARPTRMISFTDIDAADMATRFYEYRPPP